MLNRSDRQPGGWLETKSMAALLLPAESRLSRHTSARCEHAHTKGWDASEDGWREGSQTDRRRSLQGLHVRFSSTHLSIHPLVCVPAPGCSTARSDWMEHAHVGEQTKINATFAEAWSYGFFLLLRFYSNLVAAALFVLWSSPFFSFFFFLMIHMQNSINSTSIVCFSLFNRALSPTTDASID